jgi:hypothetical protein
MQANWEVRAESLWHAIFLDGSTCGRHASRMGSLKTFLFVSAMAINAPMIASASTGLTDTFATCVGRLSAQLEHEWLMKLDAAEITEQRRNAMASLLRAVMPVDDARAVLARRIEAKFAHAALLQRAVFRGKTEDADWARSHAAALLDDCMSYLLVQS